MKEKISSSELSSTLLLCIVSSSIGLNIFTTIRLAGINSYISVLIGTILGIIPLFIFIYLFNYQSNLPIYKKNTHIFGKTLGTIINYIIILLYLLIGATILFNLSNFIVSQYLSRTPLLLIFYIITILVYYTVNKGIETIFRVSTIFSVITVLSFLFSFLYLRKDVNINNLLPILEQGIKKPLIGAYMSTVITLSPIYTLLIIPKNNIVDNKKTSKYIIISYLIGTTIIFLVAFLSNAILGKYLIEQYQYPGYISLKRISLFGFIDRIENFLSLHWILSNFITLTIITYYISNTIIKEKNNKILNLLLAIILPIISYKLFTNNTTFNNYTFKVYPYILTILIFIYIIIFIGAFLKRKK